MISCPSLIWETPVIGKTLAIKWTTSIMHIIPLTNIFPFFKRVFQTLFHEAEVPLPIELHAFSVGHCWGTASLQLVGEVGVWRVLGTVVGVNQCCRWVGKDIHRQSRIIRRILHGFLRIWSFHASAGSRQLHFMFLHREIWMGDLDLLHVPSLVCCAVGQLHQIEQGIAKVTNQSATHCIHVAVPFWVGIRSE